MRRARSRPSPTRCATPRPRRSAGACSSPAARTPPGRAGAARRPVSGTARAASVDVYAATRPGLLAPQVRGDPARVYVPNSQSNTVDVIDQRTAKVIDHFAVGALPQHVSPSWDLRT